jgi:hypothetical protein
MSRAPVSTTLRYEHPDPLPRCPFAACEPSYGCRAERLCARNHGNTSTSPHSSLSLWSCRFPMRQRNQPNGSTEQTGTPRPQSCGELLRLPVRAPASSEAKPPPPRLREASAPRGTETPASPRAVRDSLSRAERAGGVPPSRDQAPYRIGTLLRARISQSSAGGAAVRSPPGPGTFSKLPQCTTLGG